MRQEFAAFLKNISTYNPKKVVLIKIFIRITISSKKKRAEAHFGKIKVSSLLTCQASNSREGDNHMTKFQNI